MPKSDLPGRSPQPPKRLRIAHLLRPHWKALTLALLAVVGVAVTDLLEPWPLKIVLDSVLNSKRMPEWLLGLIETTVGRDKFAILNFSALSVIVIAIVRALRSYAQKYL